MAAGSSAPLGRAAQEFLAAKQHAERRLAALDLRWTILGSAGSPRSPGTGRIAAVVSRGAALAVNRDDAALTVVEALDRPHLARQAIPIIDGDLPGANALDAVPPSRCRRRSRP